MPSESTKTNLGSTVVRRHGHLLRLSAGVTCPHCGNGEQWGGVVERIGGIEIWCAGCGLGLVAIEDTRTSAEPKGTHMARRSEIFPSKYLKAADLDGRAHVVIIDRAPTETFGKGDDQEPKTVLYFRDDALKPLPLNMTNWDSVAEITGEDDTTNWRSHAIEVHPAKTSMKGDTVDCVRIRAPQQTVLELKPPGGGTPLKEIPFGPAR